ncbi:MAG: hypothetical protein WDO15_27165 [Bacteroidota bacterium]
MRPRRYIAIVFLTLILCQTGGYYGVLEYLKKRMSDATTEKIVAERAPIGGHLILRIPIEYHGGNVCEYNSGDTHFLFEGSVYHVIERHVYKDVLYVSCIRNDDVSDTQETIESFTQSLAGKQGEHKTGIKFFENLSKYFSSEQYSWSVVAVGWTLEQPFGVLQSLYSYHQPKQLFRPPSVA